MKNVTLCWLLLLFSLLLFQELSVQAATRRALVFGLGKQADTSWGKIHGDNDIFYVKQMLQQAGYTDILTMKNEQATKAGMVKAFQELADRCRRGDNVYIHYSGHGQLMTDLDGDEALKWQNSHADWDEAWIPYDAYMIYGPDDRGEKHLCDDEIAALLQAIREKIGKRGELVVVVDACHSGDATCGPDDEECVRGVDLKFSIPKSINGDIPQLAEENWRTISACKPYQLCTEIKGLKTGKLTYALYKLGMKVMKQDNEKLEKTLDSFMQQHQSRIKQTPMITGKK
jgi:uncharacterized caspase-like protein